MANKFTKSVLERQAKELKQASSIEITQTVPPEDGTLPVIQEAPKKEKPEPKKTSDTKNMPDLTEYIIYNEDRAAKNKTFYLDTQVIDMLHRAAVAQKMTDSKLLNDILKKVLGLHG
jgi:hypothetical protein